MDNQALKRVFDLLKTAEAALYYSKRYTKQRTKPTIRVFGKGFSDPVSEEVFTHLVQHGYVTKQEQKIDPKPMKGGYGRTVQKSTVSAMDAYYVWSGKDMPLPDFKFIVNPTSGPDGGPYEMVLIDYDHRAPGAGEFRDKCLAALSKMAFVMHAHYYDDAIWIYCQPDRPFQQEHIDMISDAAVVAKSGR